jgi:hypothetical protein
MYDINTPSRTTTWKPILEPISDEIVLCYLFLSQNLTPGDNNLE